MANAPTGKLDNRRLPGTSRDVAVLWAVVVAARNRGDGQNIALGNSREPPASNRSSCHAVKRLPCRVVGLRSARVPWKNEALRRWGIKSRGKSERPVEIRLLADAPLSDYSNASL